MRQPSFWLWSIFCEKGDPFSLLRQLAAGLRCPVVGSGAGPGTQMGDKHRIHCSPHLSPRTPRVVLLVHTLTHSSTKVWVMDKADRDLQAPRTQPATVEEAVQLAVYKWERLCLLESACLFVGPCLCMCFCPRLLAPQPRSEAEQAGGASRCLCSS